MLAAAFRLLDVGFFRIGGERYRRRGPGVVPMSSRYVGKGRVQQHRRIIDPLLADVLGPLVSRRGGRDLLAWREGSAWVDVTSADIAVVVREQLGGRFTPKDFRTWHGTVLMAVSLAVAGSAYPEHDWTPKQGERIVTAAVREVAHHLGNTAAVARSSYIDPRVVDQFRRGRTIDLGVVDEGARRGALPTHGPAERATYDLLRRPLR